jgi:hypothetical protein
MYFKAPNNTIVYSVTEPTTHVMMAYYKSDVQCTVTFGYELKNDAAVAILKGKDFLPATKDDFDAKTKQALKALISLCKTQNIQVPGIDQMHEYFNPKTNH